MRPCPIELRERVVKAVNLRKGSIRLASRLFSVSEGFIYRLLRRQEETGHEKDPDLRVQKAIEQLFERLLELGSVGQVLYWYIEQGLSLLVRHATPTGWQTEWKRPSYTKVYRVVTYPIYGGAYAWGKTQTQVVWDAKASRQVKQIRQREQWLVLLPSRHEGYITWERFQHIQEMISSNNREHGP